ncbi:bifunctional demethylmenaquinone methyltransferase/2-methoxy-6-polyprenyl-1,4-benzoquinol methylase UbiE [Flavobacteriales bacterium]|jgi:demethylmenaquinone methyltransferase / 2-methoxy-6-polyprenyl-1,4-benzoquinol methylase|nr:bifunctional demethylmenaquinone methyltransferase/2-methoxy-6-polyprenyl-1,4-benzoquinol methylase UbiE [Flavobacteriales bacterium]
MRHDSVTPYDSEESKKEQVATMFNNIAHKYDFLNHFLSLGIDIIWRKKAIKLLAEKQPKKIIDIATGTGDFALAALKLNPDCVVGIDISQGMVDVGNKKILNKKHNQIINLKIGDSENLQFEDNHFDALTVGFGVRNFQNLKKGLSEMNRVVKPGSFSTILEFSKPKGFPIKQIYNFYFKYILPGIGKILSKDSSAYTYLPESVNAFPEGEEFIQILNEVGYKNVKQYPLMFGIASIYLVEK